MKNEKFSTQKKLYFRLFYTKMTMTFQMEGQGHLRSSNTNVLWKVYLEYQIIWTVMHLYQDPNGHLIHAPSSFIALTFDLWPWPSKHWKNRSKHFGTYSSRWTVWYITTLIYNEDKSEVYVLLSESIRNENNVFVDVRYVVIWNLYLLYNRVYPSIENVFICLTNRITLVTCFIYPKRLVISYK